MALLEDILKMQGLGGVPGSFPLLPQEQFDPAAEADAAYKAAAERTVRGVRSPARAAASQPAWGPFPGLLGLEMTGMQPTEQVDGNAPAPEPAPAFDPSIPLPRSRPAEADAPLDITPPEGATLPPNATPTAGRAPMSMMPPPAPGAPAESQGPLGKFVDRLFSPNDAATFLALGSGFAGAPSLGTGMRRAFGAAVPAAAADRAYAQKEGGQGATYRALVARGVPPQEALAATLNPDIMKATAAKYFETKRPEPKEIGRDRWGNPIQGVWDEKSQSFKTIQPDGTIGGAAAGSANTSAPVDPNLRGEEFLKTVDPQLANQVKAIAEGRAQYPTGQVMRTPYGRMLTEAVQQYDPSFNAQDYNLRSATRKGFMSGKEAQNITAFNTAIGHMDTLDKSIDKLNNSGFPLWNKVSNAVAEQFDPKFQTGLKEFQAARTAVADELTRAFRGSGGNVHDIKAWEATINSADSPVALKAAVRQATELLKSRIESVGDQYNRAMGTEKPGAEWLSPKAKSAYDRMLGDAAPEGPRAPAAPLSPGQSRQIGNVTIKRLN